MPKMTPKKNRKTRKGGWGSGTMTSTLDPNRLGSEPYRGSIGGLRTQPKPRLDEMDKWGTR
jgi:hypothetical protein